MSRYKVPNDTPTWFYRFATRLKSLVMRVDKAYANHRAIKQRLRQLEDLIEQIVRWNQLKVPSPAPGSDYGPLVARYVDKRVIHPGQTSIV